MKEPWARDPDFYDVLCQELTGIALASRLLAEKLQVKDLAESENAREIAAMAYRALVKVESGFPSMEFDLAGLGEALEWWWNEELEERSGVVCEVNWQDDLAALSEERVMDFFRIAQEAIQNALKHTELSRIEVRVRRIDNTVQLVIEDNGKELSPSESTAKESGMRLMRQRAGLMGGELKFESPSTGGTRVICTIPDEKVAANATFAPWTRRGSRHSFTSIPPGI
jgi:signal transduction histidine kinase